MLDWRVRYLADIPQRDLTDVRLGNRKTDRIPVTTPRKMRTGACVTQVAEFPYVDV